jgi:hypothetical protein
MRQHGHKSTLGCLPRRQSQRALAPGRRPRWRTTGPSCIYPWADCRRRSQRFYPGRAHRRQMLKSLRRLDECHVCQHPGKPSNRRNILPAMTSAAPLARRCAQALQQRRTTRIVLTLTMRVSDQALRYEPRQPRRAGFLQVAELADG